MHKNGIESSFGSNPKGARVEIIDKVAVITGAASGIGRAITLELARREARALALVDVNEAVDAVAEEANQIAGTPIAHAFRGSTTDADFRGSVFDKISEQYGLVRICIPAAGITRDDLAVRIDKSTGKAQIYPVELFHQVLEVNLTAPVYWALEMVARIAEDRLSRGLKRWTPEERMQGTVIFIGSISSQGNKGQISYASTKAGLEGAAATLSKEAIFYGIRCAVLHPGFTDTPMVRALGEDYINKYILPYTQLGRLIRPEEIADAICFLINNTAVSGELWADAGWHPSPA